MKIKGVSSTEPRVVTVVIPRESGDVVFKAKAVLNEFEYQAKCPMPVPPTIMKRDGTSFADLKDKKYQAAMEKWADHKSDWLMIESLKATDDLVWDTVTDDPETFGNFRTELQQAGFSRLEVSNIITAILDANGLNQSRIDEATQRFLAGPAAQQSE